jgi:hypothetical protein
VIAIIGCDAVHDFIPAIDRAQQVLDVGDLQRVGRFDWDGDAVFLLDIIVDVLDIDRLGGGGWLNGESLENQRKNGKYDRKIRPFFSVKDQGAKNAGKPRLFTKKNGPKKTVVFFGQFCYGLLREV